MPDEPQRSDLPFPVRLLAWILSGFGLLHLIRDARRVELYGLLREWVEAYALLVNRIGEFAFSWIDWSWIKVDDAEVHVLVIALLLGSAQARATAATTETPRPGILHVAEVLLATLLFNVPLLALLPSPWGVRIGLGFQAIMLLGWLAYGSLLRDPWSKRLRRELLGVLCGFLLLVMINYTLLKP